MKNYYSFFLLFFLIQLGFAQNTQIKGTVWDTKTNESLIGVVVTAKTAGDEKKYVMATDLNGEFSLSVPVNKSYTLEFGYLGFENLSRTVQVGEQPVSLGKINLKEDTKVLSEIAIEGKLPLAIQKNDTTEYNADAYKVNTNANAQDLIEKMPGVMMEDGKLQAHGEEVKRVYVDGKPFFGNDPNLALKNLPAEVIDKIQIYDKASDQSQFTGFDDGNQEKAINIITKPDKKGGVFGRVYGSLGTDYRYNAGANINIFDGDRKISILGMSNNVNQQNFSSEDLVGVSSSGGGGRGGGRGGMGGGMMGGGGANNFLTGQQNGIAQTHGFGINFTDVWGKAKKVTFSGSYFFNNSTVNKEETSRREYFLEGDSTQYYNSVTSSRTQNYNHRLNARIEYKIDDNNQLIFSPRLSYQENNSINSLAADNTLNGNFLNNSVTSRENSLIGYNGGLDVLYSHKFKKKGRTLSVLLNGNYSYNNSKNALLSVNNYFVDSLWTDSINQRANSFTKVLTGGANISYTEPIGEKSLMEFSHNVNYTGSDANKRTNSYELATLDYTRLDTNLTNLYFNNFITNRTQVAYRYNYKKVNLMVAAAYQNVLMFGNQTFPYANDLNRNYNNFLPNAMLHIKISENAQFRMRYFTRTQQPNIQQMQTVLDNSNPLSLYIGNDSLRQTYNHSLFGRYSFTNMKNANVIMTGFWLSYSENQISNSQLIALNDTILPDGTFLGSGGTLTRPVNLDGYFTARGFFNYGFPVKKMKTNFNFTTRIVYQRSPSLINDIKNFSHTVGINQGITMSSNISEKIDFTISYHAGYNIVQNSIRKNSNNNYFTQNASVRFNYQFWKGFVFNTTLNHTLYAGLTQGFNQYFFLWNAQLGYKFLKDESLELSVSVFDILNQNKSIVRNVTEYYTEDLVSNVLNRYFMVNLIYHLKFFGNGSKDIPKADNSLHHMMPPGVH